MPHRKLPDYQYHGHTLHKENRNLATTALADTGCQSCLAGPALQKGLCLSAHDLIPTSLSMSSASGHPLPILGAALTRLKLGSSGRSTRQMVYFSPKATKLYLSLATCTDQVTSSHSTSSCETTHPTRLARPRQPSQAPTSSSTITRSNPRAPRHRSIRPAANNQATTSIHTRRPSQGQAMLMPTESTTT